MNPVNFLKYSTLLSYIPHQLCQKLKRCLWTSTHCQHVPSDLHRNTQHNSAHIKILGLRSILSVSHHILPLTRLNRCLRQRPWFRLCHPRGHCFPNSRSLWFPAPPVRVRLVADTSSTWVGWCRSRDMCCRCTGSTRSRGTSGTWRPPSTCTTPCTWLSTCTGRRTPQSSFCRESHRCRRVSVSFCLPRLKR